MVDNAIPTANAPTIGDSPMDPASAAAPKKDAVATEAVARVKGDEAPAAIFPSTPRCFDPQAGSIHDSCMTGAWARDPY